MSALMSRSAAEIDNLKLEIRLLKKEVMEKGRIIQRHQQDTNTSKLLRDEANIRSPTPVPITSPGTLLQPSPVLGSRETVSIKADEKDRNMQIDDMENWHETVTHLGELHRVVKQNISRGRENSTGIQGQARSWVTKDNHMREETTSNT